MHLAPAPESPYRPGTLPAPPGAQILALGPPAGAAGQPEAARLCSRLLSLLPGCPRPRWGMTPDVRARGCRSGTGVPWAVRGHSRDGSCHSDALYLL